MSMTFDDLVRRARVTAEQLQEWVDLGLVQRGGDEFDDDALARVRLLRLAAARGLRAEAIAIASEREGDLLARFTQVSAGPRGEVCTVEEAAARSGLDVTFTRRIWAAGALGEDEASEDDIDAMRAVRTALDAGLPEAALLQLVRVLADSLGRVADAESRLFHFYVHERLRSEGLDPAQVAETTGAAIDALMDLVEPTVLYFHRKAWTRALREDVLTHLAEEVAPSGPVGQLPVAVLFVDLADFTPMTEAMGDEAAADVLDRFSELVRDEAVHCDGRVVKQIGDEFMLVFPNAAVAVRYALHLADAAAREPHFPALRMGAHVGAVLYREADYLGATVNTAARVAGQAERGQLVVTGAVRDAVDESEVAWVELGARSLKGLGEPLELFGVSAGRGEKGRTDPVCGMEVDPATAAVRSTWGGAQFFFCSEGCRQRFEVDPARYDVVPPG